MTQTVKEENEMTKITMKIDGMMCGMCEADRKSVGRERV